MKPLLNLLKEKIPPQKPPIWLMRQAGRYLPEYDITRKQAGGFLKLCYHSEFAEEVSLQPIHRFDFDASIVFADILLVPQALGQKLWFETGEGPRLEPLISADNLSLENINKNLRPVCDTISRLSKSLPKRTTLIGFAGAPWTVASYMVAGRSTLDQAPSKQLIKQDRAAFQSIIDMLTEASIEYLSAQAVAGAEILMLFESWAGSLHGKDFEHWCLKPVKTIIAGLRMRGVNCPIIAFPRATDYPLGDYVRAVDCQILGLDTNADRKAALRDVPEKIVLQGNLDPLILVAGGEALDRAVDTIIDDFSGRRFIFNLGHGILPQTPLENVTRLMDRLNQHA